MNKFVGWGAWVGCGGGSHTTTPWGLMVVAVVYMTLYADYGSHEHVFSPVSQ